MRRVSTRSSTDARLSYMTESTRKAPNRAPSCQQRECSTQVEELQQVLDIVLPEISQVHQPSFAECVDAAKKKRSGCVTSSGCHVPSPRAFSVPASRSFHRVHQSTCMDESCEEWKVPEGSRRTASPVLDAGATHADGEQTTPDAALTFTGRGSPSTTSESDDLACLKHLLRRREDELRTAARIGQRLLDTQEELMAEIDSIRDEKWQAECENDALRRDLEHATRRCEQMQHDIATPTMTADARDSAHDDLSHWGAETIVNEAESPLSASAFDQGTPSTPLSLVRSTTAAAVGEEADRLRQRVESLEDTKNILEEQLIEAQMETNALRRASIERRVKSAAELGITQREDCRQEEEHRGCGRALASGGGDQQRVESLSSTRHTEEQPMVIVTCHACKKRMDIRDSREKCDDRGSAQSSDACTTNGPCESSAGDLRDAQEEVLGRRHGVGRPDCWGREGELAIASERLLAVANSGGDQRSKSRPRQSSAEDERARAAVALRAQLTVFKQKAEGPRPGAPAEASTANTSSSEGQIRERASLQSGDDCVDTRISCCSLPLMRSCSIDSTGDGHDKAGAQDVICTLQSQADALSVELVKAYAAVARLRAQATAHWEGSRNSPPSRPLCSEERSFPVTASTPWQGHEGDLHLCANVGTVRWVKWLWRALTGRGDETDGEHLRDARHQTQDSGDSEASERGV